MSVASESALNAQARRVVYIATCAYNKELQGGES
jgi:hypothetical protein